MWRILKSEGWRGLRTRYRLRQSDWPRAHRSRRFRVDFSPQAPDESVQEVRVTVAVPVYGGLERVKLCLTSLVTFTDFRRHSLLLVDDASPSPEVVAFLQRFAASQRADDFSCKLRLHKRNQGYPATANEAMSFAPEDDVVLLNSDTVVTAGWLDKMIATAYSRETVASVTPFSNNATIASTPGFLESNAVEDVAAWGRRVERLSGRLRPEIPTGVGFCLYLRREALREVGYFDAKAFGKGYGEETDWCARATAQGWVHLLEDSTFVFHEGSESFGVKERLQRVETAEKLMETRHPDYRHRVGSFITRNPLSTYHWLHAESPEPSGSDVPPRVLFLHARPPERRFGGAEQQLRDLMKGLKSRGWPVGVLYPWNDSFILSQTRRGIVSEWESADSSLESLDHLARAFAPSIIHVQHVHGLPLGAAKVGEGIPRVLALHDFEYFCPHADLREQPEGEYCGFCIDLSRCERCLTAGGLDFLAQSLGERRERAEGLLNEAESVVAPSAYLAESFKSLMPSLKEKYRPLQVIPHGTPGGIEIIPRAQGITKVAFLGTFQEVKGSRHFAELAAHFRDDSVEWWIVGGVEDHLTLDSMRQKAKIRTTGPYAREALSELLGSIQPQVVVIPTPIPESWCFTMTEALAAGLTVLAYDHGAVAERLRELDLVDCLVDLEKGPSGLANRLQSWLRNGTPSFPAELPTWSIEEMVDVYERVYRSALASPTVITGMDK